MIVDGDRALDRPAAVHRGHGDRDGVAGLLADVDLEAGRVGLAERPVVGPGEADAGDGLGDEQASHVDLDGGGCLREHLVLVSAQHLNGVGVISAHQVVVGQAARPGQAAGNTRCLDLSPPWPRSR